MSEKLLFWTTFQTLRQHLKWYKPQKKQITSLRKTRLWLHCVCVCLVPQESCHVPQTGRSAVGMTECVCGLNKSATGRMTAATILTKTTVVSRQLHFLHFHLLPSLNHLSLFLFSSVCGQKAEAVWKVRILLYQSPLHPGRAAVQLLRRLWRWRFWWARLQGM